MYFSQAEFGNRIRELRKLKGMTQEELAEELNISFEHFNKIERGRNGCSIDLVIELSVYFDVSTDYLLTGRDYCGMASRKRLQNVLDELKTIINEMD